MPWGAARWHEAQWTQSATDVACCGALQGALGTPEGAEGSPCAAAWPFPCEVEAGVFEVPAGYTVLGMGRSEPLRDEDDDLLQFAIQQSLLDAGTETDQVRPRPPHLDTPHTHLDTPLTCGHTPTGDHLGGADQHPPRRGATTLR